MGAHGGSGESSIVHLNKSWCEAEHTSPAGQLTIIRCRTDAYDSTCRRMSLQQALADVAGGAQVLALTLVGDSSAKLTGSLLSLRQSAGWLIAFILYKPVAATIYAICFSMNSGRAFGTTEGQASGY